MCHPEAPKLNPKDNPKHHKQPQGIDDDRIPMVEKSKHENTDSIQDALTWTYESQVYKAKTCKDLQAAWQGHVPSY